MLWVSSGPPAWLPARGGGGGGFRGKKALDDRRDATEQTSFINDRIADVSLL